MSPKHHDTLFRLLAPVYDYLIRPPEMDRIRTLLNIPAGGRLLDLGGGTGRVSGRLTGAGIDVVVSDINRPMLRQAGRKPRVIPLLSDAQSLPFPDNCIDGVLVVDALHHFIDPEAVFTESLRVLKPGGRLLIEEQDISTWPIKLVNLAEKAVGLHSHFLTADVIKSLFEPSKHTIHFETGRFFTFRILVTKR